MNGKWLVMMGRFLALLVGSLCLPTKPLAFGDSLAWAPQVGSLEKPDYSTAQAVYRASSADGVQVTFKLTHGGTSPGLFSYSKWEVERWGDPAGLTTPPGSWQVVSSATNPIVFALWGYWGNGGTALIPGATTSYQLQIDFDRPVEDLTFQINGIDALATASGNNAFDQLTITSSLEGIPQPSPDFEYGLRHREFQSTDRSGHLDLRR